MKILNFGSCNIDYVYSLAHIVKAGETLSSHQLNAFPGGKGLNQSVSLSRAGVKVYHAGCVGENGGLLTDLLTENGVDISFLKKVEGMNGHAMIQVSNDGENAIVLYAGSNAMVTKEYVDHVLFTFGEGDILVLQNEISSLGYIAEQAYHKGMCIVLNPSPINEQIREIDFRWLRYLILNEIEAMDLSGCDTREKCLAYFKREYPQLKVMLTLGKNGCIYQDSQQTCYHPIFETRVVDTTAAGDTFTGYFVAGIAQGKAVERVLQEASCASAIAVSRMGAAPSIPTADEVMQALKTMKTKQSVLTDIE